MSFLTGLGAFAGGLDQTLGPLLQQYQQNVATGQGIAAMYGGQPQQQGGLQGLMGGGAPNVPVQAPQTAAPQPSTVPVSAPQVSQTQLSSVPQLSQPPSTPVPPQAQPSPMPASAPRTAQGGQSLGRMPQQASAPPQAQPQPQPQQQQQKPPPDLSPFNNQFDFNTLMQAVVRHNTGPNGRPNYEQIGRIANSPAFERMLTQQGLTQYKALNFGERQYEFDTRMKQQKDLLDTRETAIADRQRAAEGFRVGLATSGANVQNLSRQREEINKQVVAGIITPAVAAPQIKKLDDAIAGELAKMNSLKPGEGGGSEGGASSDEQQSIENAKEAIKVNPGARDKIIQKLKSVYPDASVD